LVNDDAETVGVDVPELLDAVPLAAAELVDEL
jgi:hypothetical protein